MADVDDSRPERDASSLNRELTTLLIQAGEAMGFTVVPEYTVPGGRIDVVWTWRPPTPVPGLDIAVPVVGIEIESSWRTRKHVKGDLLNLRDAGVALGVIVLAGSDPRDEGLRRFAGELIDRPGATVLIWTEADVRALARGDQVSSAVETAAAEAPMRTPLAATAGASHQGKYRALADWLATQERSERRVTFTRLERDAGIVLPASARRHVAHWHSYQTSAVARAIIDAGWHASRVDFNSGEVSLVPGPPPRGGARSARR